jgi:hypothetical protein
MVSRHAVTPRQSVQRATSRAAETAADAAPAGGMAEEKSPIQTQGGNCLYEHHHGHDERAEACA